VLAQSSALELKPLAFDVARDIEGFSSFVLGVARTIYKSDGISMLDTKSVVLVSASGVG
jgi:hypothetical protein